MQRSAEKQSEVQILIIRSSEVNFSKNWTNFEAGELTNLGECLTKFEEKLRLVVSEHFGCVVS